MIRICNFPIEDTVVPQAIFWRPLQYFSTVITDASDDLDSYSVSTFEIGNWLRFDMRHYRAFPALTATLYLASSLNEFSDIRHAINRVVDEFSIPKLSVAWRRGQPFQYGKLERPLGDRLREPEARILALKIALMQPDRKVSTETLIDNIPRFTSISEIDKAPSRTRPNQPQWHQIVRNVISHRNNPIGPFHLGYAERIKGGLAVTDKGVEYLKGLGFVV